VYLGLKKHRQIRSPLITIFYRDGFVFFLALAGERLVSSLDYAKVTRNTGTSIVNIVLLFSLPVRVTFDSRKD
jgi:hypothetical protein